MVAQFHICLDSDGKDQNQIFPRIDISMQQK